MWFRAEGGLEQRNGVIQEVELRYLLAVDVIQVTATGLPRSLDLVRKSREQVLPC